MAELANNAGLIISETDDDSIVVYDATGNEVSDEIITEKEKSFNQLLSQVEDIASKDKSLKDAILEIETNLLDDPIMNYFLSAYLEFNYGTDVSNLSSLNYDSDSSFGGKEMIVLNGYDSIVSYLAKDVEVHLDTMVTRIDYSNDIVSIQTSNQLYEADYVVVTVPLSILKDKDIDFEPSLPSSLQNSIDKMEMESLNKFALEFDHAFWDVDQQYISYLSDEKG